jgi:GWxTD domain-containing protein
MAGRSLGRTRAKLVILIAVSISTMANAQRDKDTKPLETEGVSPGVWQRWLDRDVRWIVTEQERAAFLRLTTDQDRDNFIERFWGHHDKEENYRRIGYTNEQFNVMLPGGRPGIPGIPGWLTDRGRIYIAYGPPDAIRETAGDEKSAAAILWHYSSIPEYGKDVELRFVDVCGCGDYRLQTFPKNR